MSQTAYISEKILLIAVAIDLALGGNGYLITIGLFRVREILFAICVPWAVLRLTVLNPVKVDRKIMTFVIAFIAMTALDALLGYLKGNNLNDIIGEIKPLAYFPMLLFFAVAIRSISDVTMVARILVGCGIIMSVAYLLVLLAAFTGVVSYLAVFNALGSIDEFIFRQAVDRQLVFIGFFYKGFFYVAIAMLFMIFGRFAYGRLVATICGIALAMTLTRSLFVGFACAALVGLLLQWNWRRSIVPIGQLGVMAIIMLIAVQAETNLNLKEFAALGVIRGPADLEKYASQGGVPPPVPPPTAAIFEARPTDNERIRDVKFVFQNTNAASLLVGNGLGAQIRDRDRVELNYLEVLFKQGLVGLGFWLLLIGYVTQLYFASAPGSRDLAAPFLLSGIFVYVATAFNTVLTGSIGMGAVFISIASLDVISRCRPAAGVVPN
ncbi:MFS family permease [Bradyrhizobium sp. LB11.1]